MPIADSPSPSTPGTMRDYYNRRLGQLDTERQSFRSHWRELTEYIQPRRGRYQVQDRNKGQKRHNSIINSKGTQALRTATSGMLAGTMSPTRPWFSLETQNPELMEVQEVKEWLHKVELILQAIYNRSNFYSQATNLLEEILLFGTGCMTHLDDFEDVARFYAHTVGSYYVAQDSRFTIDTLVRKFQWTGGQLIDEFGIDNVSDAVKTSAARGDFDQWHDVIHFIEPNNDYHPHSPFAMLKPFKSVYYEPSTTSDRWLRRSGFDEFPVYAPRWDVTGEDIYGTNCPGMTSLGDVRSLQIEERRKAQAIDKMVNPPLTGPASVRNVPISSLPGGLTIYDGSQGEQRLAPLYIVEPRINELRADMDAVERRIETAFFVDLFMAITNMEGIQPRNQLDLMQRNEERLLQLGPVLERLQGEWLDPLIDRTFNQCVRAEILPDPPEVLAGRELNVKYISTLAMAQRAVATGNIERLASFAGNLVSMGWEASIDKFNADQAIDEYARAIGSTPTLVVPDDVVAEQRAQQAQQQSAQLLLESSGQAADTAKTLSETDTTQPSALTELVGEVQ